MNDAPRSSRPASRSPRRNGGDSAPLGELEFSDWYQIPVFEPDEDELTEEIATAGRGPRRLVARAKLARDARRAHRGPKWDSPLPAAPPRPARPPEPVVDAVAPKPAPAPRPVAAPKPAVAPKPAPAPRPVRVPKPAVPPVAATEAATKPVAASPAPSADPDRWVTSGPALTEESMQLDLDRENVWRRRFNDFLDRWAASEVAVAQRLDQSLERVLSQNFPKSIPDLLAAATKRGEER